MPESGRPVYRAYQWLWSGLDLLFPPVCGGCGRRGARWCQDCHQAVSRLLPPLCERCGQGLPRAGICETCLSTPPHFTAARSWAVFEGPIRQALHRLKYRRDLSLGEILSRPMVRLLGELDWPVDLVVPVPLGVARLRERGYNQATLLARPLALGYGCSFRPQALSRVRETCSQVGLSIVQRRENVSGAFQARTGWVSGRNVLVVDDVATSSATLDACASALLAGGAAQVFGLTLARARHREPDTRTQGSIS
jgi:competence protein ComFC